MEDALVVYCKSPIYHGFWEMVCDIKRDFRSTEYLELMIALFFIQNFKNSFQWI